MNQSQIIKICFLLLITVLLAGCSEKANTKFTIACAANMQYPVEEIVEAFERINNLDCNVIISSSGKLTAQIMEGAPYDLFLSADMKYPEELFKKGWSNSAPKIYAYGQLVFWTNKVGVEPTIMALTQENVRHIAIANPKTAPYGRAALEALEVSGLLTEVKNRLVFGESISQTNQFILSGAAEIGVTAKSSLFSPYLLNSGKWQNVNEEFYSPIKQGVVVLNKRGQFQSTAKKFYEFLFSDQGKEILNKFGYSTPK